jgi:hypothetical protein
MERKTPDVTIFGNMRIDSRERLLRLRDSLDSLGDPARFTWSLNFRGRYKEQAAATFLPLIDAGVSVKLFDQKSSGSWRLDSLEMTRSITSNLVLIWLEDHICVGGHRLLWEILRDVQEKDVEIVPYSFFFSGEPIRSYPADSSLATPRLRVLDYDSETHRSRLRLVQEEGINAQTYIVSLASIMKKDLFRRLLITPPAVDSNWPRDAPYDIEQPPHATYWLPLRVGVPTAELFASIDDDHGQPGYSLISRGLYPNRVPERMTGTRPRQTIVRILRQMFSSLDHR